MKNPTILTIDMSAIGATTLFEIRDALQAEFDACKDSSTSELAEAAAQAGYSLKKLDNYLRELDIKRPADFIYKIHRTE